MTQIYENKEFSDFYDRNSKKVFQNTEFRKCRFVSCSISITRNPQNRTTVRNVQFIQCEEIGCAIDSAIIENVTIDGLKTHGELKTWGAVFRHVSLQGNIGKVMISPIILPGLAKPQEQAAFDKENSIYYQEVDWALDISNARFLGCDIRGVPVNLIRRDPETQVIITREKALLGEWRKIDLSKTLWKEWIDFFIQSEEPAIVLVAPRRHREFADWLEGLKILRDVGVAEPD
jgi:hypothetical protein